MNIRSRTIIITAAYTFLVALTISMLSYSVQRAQLMAESERRVKLALVMLEEMSEIPLRDGDILTLAHIADRVAHGTSGEVLMADRQGVILVDSSHENYGKTNKAILTARRLNREYIIRVGEWWQGAVPVLDDSGRLGGVVFMTLSARPLLNALDRLLETAVILALVFIVMGGLLSSVFGGYLSRMFTPLLVAIRKSTSSDLSSRAPMVKIRELDEVGRAFNRMSYLVERRMRDLEKLNRLSLEMSAAKSIEELADSVCRTSSLLVPKGTCHLIVGDPAAGILRVVGEQDGVHRVTAACAASLVVRERRAFTIGTRGDLEPGTQVAEGIKPASGVVAPLVTADEGPVGLILVTFDPLEVASPGWEDAASISAIANLTASPLASVQQMKAQEQAVEALRDMLLPEKVPEMKGAKVYTRYEPADKPAGFGGDFYDFLPLDGHIWGVAMGDVSGHGLEAGRYTAMAKYVLRSYALESRVPADILNRTNSALTVQMGGVMFISLFFGILDLRLQRFTYSSAGHPPGLLHDLKTGAIHELGFGGVVLGVNGNASFTEETVDLTSGSLLVLYTDGIIEARKHGELYGIERLKRVVSVNAHRKLSDIADTVVEDIRSFTDGIFQDDIAMVLIRPE